LEAAEKSLSAAVSICSSDASAKEWTAALNDHAVLLLRLGRDSEAADKLEEARSIASAGGWDDVACCVNRNKGLLAFTQERPQEGLGLLNTAFQEGRAADDAVGNGQILNNVAVLRLLEDDTAEAMQLFNRAILLEQRGGDLRGLAFTYNNLGLVFSGHTRGDHFAAIPFMEMALPLLTGPIDVLGRLYVLNNSILVHEHAHLEPARKLRVQFGDTLKSFHSSFPHRALDAERIVYEKEDSESFSEPTPNDEWDISPAPVLLRPCSRCGPQEI
jgi:tetratricopeptide (TPR) repeat protein